MPHYHTLGKIPAKRHTQFRKPDGNLYSEQLHSTYGFSEAYSLSYHCHPPTMVMQIDDAIDVSPVNAIENNMQHRSFKGFQINQEKDYLTSRKCVLYNSDLQIQLAAPTEAISKYFYKNAMADEVIFVHIGEGKLRTMFGNIEFRSGDHLVIPRGVIYQFEFKQSDNRLFIVESYSPVRYPSRYINSSGQLLEHAPFCERDIRPPVELETHNETGDFRVMIKKGNQMFSYHYASHPFDIVGWDGNHYPYAFSIHDFEPITGRVHQPPPVHQTFQTDGFVMCAFVPRLFDYHPKAIPTPYNHSNVDSDEVLYYVDGEFMSRKHVEKGQITLHPIGIPHGPHPGAVEKSLGAKETMELAVMVDTFKPLKITKNALEIEEKDYFKSWLY